MFAMSNGSLACPDTGRQHRLADRLADMMPGAATIRVSLVDAGQAWPHPHIIVKDEAGETLQMGRVAVRGTARRIMRVCPDAYLRRPHTLKAAYAALIRSDLTAVGRSR
ncbi:transcriptional regulator [Streptomyces sp. NPDC059166]|uniref:transcriptional regulator n=1 Tax=Streptomyces sp. NPDC059166 TaxID=3346752 RepID=UPI00368633A8